MRYKRHFPK